MSIINKLVLATLSLAVLIFAAVPVRADQVVYTNNFTTSTTSPGATATLTGGQAQTSPNGQQFLQLSSALSSANLTIGGLQPNSTVTLTFNLYGIQSLDGNSTIPGTGPDGFRLTADNTELLNNTFSNGNPLTAGFGQSFGCPGGNCAPATGASAINTLGYTFPNQSIGDSTYNLTFTTTADAAGAVMFSFLASNLQPPGDESFGLDNIVVSGSLPSSPTAVPEPATMLLLGTGLAGVAAKVGRRNSRGVS